MSRRANTTIEEAVDSYYVQGRVYPEGTGEIGQVLQQLGVPSVSVAGGDHVIEVRDCSDGLIAQHSFAPALIDVEAGLAEFASFNFVLEYLEGVCPRRVRCRR